MVGGSQMLLVSVALIVLTFAALEWREAHELQHARARRRRREWLVGADLIDSCGNAVGDRARARFAPIAAVGLFAGSLSALSGCATLRGEKALSTELLLAKAGFERRNADTPEPDATRRTDPVNCHCLFVGGPQQYVEYQRLATEREAAEGQLWADDDRMDWGLWRGWLR